MYRVVGVRYKTGCKIYDFDAGELELSAGDTVVVNSEQGMGCAKVVVPPTDLEELPEGKELKKVIRKATEDDLYRIRLSAEKEAEAFRFCQQKITEREMVMKLVRVEWAFDNSRATFYFTADGRVDFRELVRDLAYRFKIRIEMRQIGVRDEAKMLGGFGPCGRELCCASFLRDFEPVSIKMAKKQDLVLNPQKISGVCGRLMCCLGYEYSFYDEIKKDEKRRQEELEKKKKDEAESEKVPELVPEYAGEKADKPDEQPSKSKRKRRAWRKKKKKPEGQADTGSKDKAAGPGQKPAEKKESGGEGQKPKSGSKRRRRRGGRGRGKGGQPGSPGGGDKPSGGTDKPTGQ